MHVRMLAYLRHCLAFSTSYSFVRHMHACIHDSIDKVMGRHYELHHVTAGGGLRYEDVTCLEGGAVLRFG